jgi:hypothetical protein
MLELVLKSEISAHGCILLWFTEVNSVIEIEGDEEMEWKHSLGLSFPSSYNPGVSEDLLRPFGWSAMNAHW